MDHDKELISMETMVPTMSTLLMANNNHHNYKPPSSRSTSYGPLGLENDDNFFDGILATDQSMQNGSDSHLVVSSNSNSKDIIINSDNNDNFPMKRALTSRFWNETGSPGSSSSSKRFHGDLNSGSTTVHEENNSFVSLLSQLPQSAALHPNAILGSVGDGVMRQQFQLPGINWN